MAPITKPPPPLGAVLVTGGCGFLGSHIVDLLLQRYATDSTTTVHVLDLSTSRNTFPHAKYHSADITSAPAVRAVLEAVQPRVVIHTASPVFTSGTAKSLEVMRRVNVEGTRVLLEASRQLGGVVRAFVYTSSASVLSDQRTDLRNADERWSVIRGGMQGEYYTETKALAEDAVLKANTPRTLLTTALRPSAMFGERDVQVFAGTLGAYTRGQTHWQIGANDNLFDFTYVVNVAHAHLLAAARLLETWDNAPAPDTPTTDTTTTITTRNDDNDDDEKEDPVAGEAFLISNAAPVYFWDFARAVWASYHAHLPPHHQHTHLPPPPPTPPGKAHVLSFELALVLATLATWLFWALRLGEPKLDPARVRFTCMTRYFRTEKARLVLGYRPVVSLEEGVSRTGRWFAERDLEEASAEGKEGKKGR